MEIRIHGRSGQGAVVAARMLVAAFSAEGKYAAGFPMFGFERRGAPVVAFVRFASQPVREKTQIYSPDCLIVMDPSQIMSPLIFDGLNPRGILVLNTSRPPHHNSYPSENIETIGSIDATKIALEETKLPIVNTCMLGAFAATSGWLKIESILTSLKQYLTAEILSKNIRSAERGFREVKIEKYQPTS